MDDEFTSLEGRFPGLVHNARRQIQGEYEGHDQRTQIGAEVVDALRLLLRMR